MEPSVLAYNYPDFDIVHGEALFDVCEVEFLICVGSVSKPTAWVNGIPTLFKPKAYVSVLKTGMYYPIVCVEGDVDKEHELMESAMTVAAMAMNPVIGTRFKKEKSVVYVNSSSYVNGKDKEVIEALKRIYNNFKLWS
ncbi:MAG: hypothetical protein ACK5XN_15725 [Bacteroidota bacterium]